MFQKGEVVIKINNGGSRGLVMEIGQVAVVERHNFDEVKIRFRNHIYYLDSYKLERFSVERMKELV